MGQLRRFGDVRFMSACPPIADMAQSIDYLTSCAIRRPERVQQTTQLLDDLVGATEQRDRDGEAEFFRGLEVQEQFNFR
jgi:hypothetical protein